MGRDSLTFTPFLKHQSVSRIPKDTRSRGLETEAKQAMPGEGQECAEFVPFPRPNLKICKQLALGKYFKRLTRLPDWLFI